jgi:purine-binding chemotaxis protein CheW
MALDLRLGSTRRVARIFSPHDMTTSQAPASPVQLLVFEIGNVRYALELRCVREIVRAVLIVPLPDAPDVVEGVIRARGEIVPVYDLRLRFGHPPRPLHPDERLVIAWTGERLVAFRCDHADRIEEVDPSAIDAPPPMLQGGRHIAGVAALPEGLALIHDLQTFLEAAERETLDTALGGLLHC